MRGELDPDRAEEALERASSSLAPLCVDLHGLGLMLGVSARTVRRLNDSGKLPPALALGGCKRWFVEEVVAWLRAGGPPRRQWVTMRRSAS